LGSFLAWAVISTISWVCGVVKQVEVLQGMLKLVDENETYGCVGSFVDWV
jgi:hypothetical protein